MQNINISRAIEQTQDDIERLEVGLHVLADLPDLRGVRKAHASNDSVYIIAIYDLETYRRNRRLLQDNDWEIQDKGVFVTDDGWRYTRLTHPDGGKISYIMEPQLEGSTCKLITTIEMVEKTTCTVVCESCNDSQAE